MRTVNPYADLERERRKLIRLIDDTLKKGIPITQNEVILAQSRKVDTLILRTPLMNRKNNKNQPER